MFLKNTLLAEYSVVSLDATEIQLFEFSAQ